MNYKKGTIKEYLYRFLRNNNLSVMDYAQEKLSDYNIGYLQAAYDYAGESEVRKILIGIIYHEQSYMDKEEFDDFWLS